MRVAVCLILSMFIAILIGCSKDAATINERDVVLKDIETQRTELKKLFDQEIKMRNEFHKVENPDLMFTQDYLDRIKLLSAKRKDLDTNIAKNLREYYLEFNDEVAHNDVLAMYIKPKIEIIHNLTEFQDEIARKQIISEMLEEYKNGNVQENQVLHLLDDFKAGKNTKYLPNLPIDSESSIQYNEVFTQQYSMLERFIGEHLTALQKYFGEFEEVREVDNKIVRPYYKRLISSIPRQEKQLTTQQKRVLNDYLNKIIKLFPFSDLTVKAQRKLIPLTAKKRISELSGTSFILFLAIMSLITIGYTICMRGFLKHKQTDIVESRIFKPMGSQQFPKVDSDFSLISPVDKED